VIGIVIVSHSATLAAGVLELARGMAGEEAPLAAAGGMALPDQPLGTDPGLVLEAIESVYSEDGVLVLLDLGSAVLSAEMALDMLPPEHKAKVFLCEAPLVEGAVSAAVQARLGSPMAQVLAEARGALVFKAEHLQPEAGAAPQEAPVAAPAETVQLTVKNRLGLHARPAARFVQTAGRFRETRVTVRNLSTGKGPAEARSINALATLGVRQGHLIEVGASGPEAAAALAALEQLAADNFGDVETEVPAAVPPPPAPGPAAGGGLQGIPASGGIALGRIVHARARAVAVPTHAVTDPGAEWTAFTGALESARRRIAHTRDEVARRSDPQAAAIFEAHLLFLEDAALLEPVRAAVFGEKLNAAAAWDRAIQAMAGEYRAMDEAYLQARAADVLDVGAQVLEALLGGGGGALVLDTPGILVAPDLTPADTARLDPAMVLALCTAQGGPTSHSAILARTFGIPAVVGLGEAILALPEGVEAVVDADRGRVIPEPEAAVRQAYLRQAEERKAEAERARAESARPAVTRDGRRIEIAANVGSVAEARAAVALGAEGVGLLRTEFLYLDRTTPPDEEEQYQAYAAIAEVLAGRPVIIRTLDIGGDKPLPYLPVEPEANPFLGWRAVRLCLARPELFRTQLRAIVRVAARFPVKVMFPMVATLEELRAAKEQLALAIGEAKAAGHPVPERLETGIMVEIPAAAVRAEQLAPEVDFFSIGTNDLTQYTLAAERGNARVAHLADALHPAVLELIGRVAEAAHRHGKWVGICGELGGEPAAAPILLGLGLDELSMSAPSIPKVKQVLRELDARAAQALAREALGLGTAGEVRALAGR
jgi:phosphocarrier protein FPr